MEKSQFGDEKEFAEQWKVVREKYPFVASRYLELINHILGDWHQKVWAFDGICRSINICDPDSPIRATEEFCKWLEKPKPIGGRRLDLEKCDSKNFSNFNDKMDCDDSLRQEITSPHRR